LYIWQAPLILAGIFFLIKNKSKSSAVLFSWVLLAPIPASLTQDYMHAGRAQALFPALTVISAIGLYKVLEILSSKKQVRILISALVILIVASLLGRIDNYLFHTFNNPLGGLQQGYKEAINFSETNINNYDKVIFTKAHSEPHAFLGFYSKVDPYQMQTAASDWKKFETDGLRFLDMMDYKLGKYEFKNVDFHRDRNQKNALIIASPEEIPSLVIPKLQITDDSGKVVFVVIDTNGIPE
jgi:hypothetical protein